MSTSYIKLKLADIERLATEVRALCKEYRSTRELYRFAKFKRTYTQTFGYKIRKFFGMDISDNKIEKIMFTEIYAGNYFAEYGFSYTEADNAAYFMHHSSNHALSEFCMHHSSEVLMNVKEYTHMLDAATTIPDKLKEMKEFINEPAK